MPTIPPGYVQCEVCGEFNGSTDARTLSWLGERHEAGQVSVTCLCHGIPGPRCKTRLIHRPISNTFDPESNSIEHTPVFLRDDALRSMPYKGAGGREGRKLV
jgi:hypothetical protein